MGRISSGVGLLSGLNSRDIIDQLIRLESRPREDLAKRVETANTRRTALTTIQAQLTQLRLFGTQVKKPQTFRAASVTSTNEQALTGTAAVGAAAGSYRFSVARLVSSQQAVSAGRADVDVTPVGAGKITLELGGGELNTPTKLENLNGDVGVRRGSFRITDRRGDNAVIDITDAVTLDDVVRKINGNLEVAVRAEVDGDRLVLTDQTGISGGNLRVDDLDGSFAATDLGIAKIAGDGSIEGDRIRKLANTTNLKTLNDGRGVKVNSSLETPDFKVVFGNGEEVEISLAGVQTVGDVQMRIAGAIGTRGWATLNSDGNGFSITDRTFDYNAPPPEPDPVTGEIPDPPEPATNFRIEAMNGSTAAADLGLDVTPTNGSIRGSAAISMLNSTMISSLRGGQGLDLGTIRIRDKGSQEEDINLSGARSVSDILDRINDAFGGRVIARLNGGGNGIEIEDRSNGLGSLSIEDVSGSAAEQLGIEASIPRTGPNIVRGANLQRAWFSRDLQLSETNGGRGVPEGQFRITDSAGRAGLVRIDSTIKTVGDLIDKINALPNDVTASINANGDGLLLTDTANGSLKMRVSEEANGTVAKALNLLGTATTTTIDGSWEKTIDITATDKLVDVQKKINDAGWGVNAAIINDGAGVAPFRLSMTTTGSGVSSRVAFDFGATSLDGRIISQAQDAVVFLGGENGGQPVMVTAGSNTVSGVVPGLSLQLNGVTKDPVTLNVARNVDNVVEQANKFVEDFNGMLDAIKEATKFDTETNVKGVLFGETAVRSIETELYGAINTVVNEEGKYRIASDVGMRIGAGGRLEFDEAKFRKAYADDPEAVIKVFTNSAGSLDEETRLDSLNAGRGVGRTASATDPDMRVALRDGTTFDVNLSAAGNIADVINLINEAGNGKVTAAVGTDGTRIRITDNTPSGSRVAGKRFLITPLNQSSAVFDLGLNRSTSDAAGLIIDGKPLTDANAGTRGGLGVVVERRINRLIDPVSGIVTRAGRNIDSNSDAWTRRIDSLDKLIASKRARLERQFANLENNLARLQTQQQSLGSIQQVRPPAAG